MDYAEHGLFAIVKIDHPALMENLSDRHSSYLAGRLLIRAPLHGGELKQDAAFQFPSVEGWRGAPGWCFMKLRT